MLESLLLEITDPRTQAKRGHEYSTAFSIGSRKPADLIIDGEFIGIKHGVFDYDRERGWQYFDWHDAYKPTSITRGDGTIYSCDGKMMKIQTGDELVFNDLVHVKVIRALGHDGKIISQSPASSL